MVMPSWQAASVVTVHELEVVVPTVAAAVLVSPAPGAEFMRKAIESPLTNPATDIPPQTPLRAMLKQEPEQVAVKEPLNPLSVTASLL